MASNTKITRIETNTAQKTVGFYNGTRLLRIVSIVKEASINTTNDKIIIQSSGLPSFEFDVFSIIDVDGTAYNELNPQAGSAGENYQVRIAEILAQLYTIFQGCCTTDSPSGGQGSIQWQDEGVNVGTAGQYTTINITGNATATEVAPDTLEIDVTGGPGGSHQQPIQFEDEGVHLGSSGSATSFNVVGELHEATRSGNQITLTAPSVGENLRLPSLDPSNPLSGQIGSFNPNFINYTTSASRNHNINPTGWNDAWDGSAGTGKATTIFYTGSDYSIITGVQGGVSGRYMRIFNSSLFPLILENQSPDSTSANRFRTLSGVAVFLPPSRYADFYYVNGSWTAIYDNGFDSFEDFTNINILISGVSQSLKGALAFNCLSTTGGTLAAENFGAITMAPATNARSIITFGSTGNYNSGLLSSPRLSVFKMKAAASIAATGKLWMGSIAGTIGAATPYVAATGSFFGWDSASVHSNFFIYSGIGGSLAELNANGLNTGLTMAEVISGYVIFVVYEDIANAKTRFFYSTDLVTFVYAGARDLAPLGATQGLWYGASGVTATQLTFDYIGCSVNIPTNR